jgi:hypothetical protein
MLHNGKLKCSQWLLGKMNITVTGAKLLHVHSVSQFSWQPPTPFESSFNFPDQLNPPKLVQRPKMFCCANRRPLFPRLLTSSHAPAGAQYFSVFFQQLLTPFQSSFYFPDQLNQPKLVQKKAKNDYLLNSKSSNDYVLISNFQGSGLNHENLSNCCTSLISISFFWTITSSLNAQISCQYSCV